MGHTFEQAVAIVNNRRAQQSQLIRKMIEVQQRYNGDLVLPLPSQEKSDRPSLAPSLIVDAVDQPALRASSVMPRIYCPALDPDKDLGVKSKEYARTRRRALGATYFHSDFELLRRRMFRHIGGYGSSALVLVADEKNEMPRIELRDPLSAYPDPRAPEDAAPPLNCGFVYQRSATWLIGQYGDMVTSDYGGPILKNYPQWLNELWDIVEWVDDENCYIGIMSPHSTNSQRAAFPPPYAPFLVKAYKNKAGMCTVVVPQTITLDKIFARLTAMIGKVDTMAYLIDLDIMATEKSIAPDRYILARQGQQPQLVGNTWKDGSTGEVNMIFDADAVGELRGTPDPNNKNTISQLERLAQMDGGTVSAQRGETMGALRTGRGIDTMMGVAVDPRVQELQEIAQAHFRRLNNAIFAMYEGWWPSHKYVMFTGWPGDMGHVKFTPNKEMAESHESVVMYPIPGADQSQMTVALGQLVQAQLISREEARRLHPWVSDAEGAAMGVAQDEIRMMVLQSLQARAAANGLPPVDAARIAQLIGQGHMIENAVVMANAEAQARQAAQPPEPGEGQVAAPEAMPGLGQPGEGGEMGGGAPQGQPVSPGLGGTPGGVDIAKLTGALVGSGGTR